MSSGFSVVHSDEVLAIAEDELHKCRESDSGNKRRERKREGIGKGD
jgi:hypothetical protein